MQLTFGQVGPVIQANKNASLVCSWSVLTANGFVPADAVFPLTFRRTDGTGQNTILLDIPPKFQIRMGDGQQFYLTYNFTVRRSDHQSVYRCTAKMQGVFQEEKSVTLYVYDVPDTPVLKGPVTLAIGWEGVWTCVSDCATKTYPEVKIIVSDKRILAASCATCFTIQREKYKDGLLDTYKVVVTLKLTAERSWKIESSFNLVCRSNYDPDPTFSTKFSNMLSVKITKSEDHQSRNTANNGSVIVNENERSETPKDREKDSRHISDGDASWTWWLLLVVTITGVVGGCVAGILREHSRLKKKRQLVRKSEEQNVNTQEEQTFTLNATADTDGSSYDVQKGEEKNANTQEEQTFTMNAAADTDESSVYASESSEEDDEMTISSADSAVDPEQDDPNVDLILPVEEV